ncbi:malonate decarboxylase subunit epsilon [Chondromyces crocatus]|uniref:Malonyl CoA-acyl carrier protein transacylase n=1 Tax=Chondromyces crocatus TaxID=52 RepID=A0A0K1ESP8_CHOCO|nr:malonate decarboxylase subunit epsilon [Chondromyces crocatus]AKT43891.1 malonate decarboxylase subunit epsilon [Chondromyces crocatus]
MNVAFLCPGQGVQTPDMLDRLPDHPAVDDTLDQASALLGQDVRALPRIDALHATTIQLTTLIAGVAAARALAAEETHPDAAAGLSIGAFTAAVLCGALDFAHALAAVKYRAERMHAAYPQGYGLASLLGLNEPQVAALVQTVSTPEVPVYLAIINAPRQIVLAGAVQALDRAIEHALAAGAHRAVRLAVPVPSHCPLLDDVATDLARFLEPLPITRPRIPYLTNRGGRATRDPALIRHDLATNLAFPVRWHDATTVLTELGTRLFVEMPPGHVLTDLAANAFPEARAVALADTRLATVVRLIQQRHAPH